MNNVQNFFFSQKKWDDGCVITELFGSAIPLTIHSDQPETSAGGPKMLCKDKKRKSVCLHAKQEMFIGVSSRRIDFQPR